MSRKIYTKLLNDKYVITIIYGSFLIRAAMAQLTDKKLLMQIALRLKALREARSLTQEQVYFDTGIHVGRIETARLNLSVSTLAALCDYFNIDLPTFFTFDQPIQ